MKKNRRGNKAKISVTEDNLYYLNADLIAEVLDIPVTKIRKKIKKNSLNISNKGEKVSWFPGEGYEGMYFYGEAIDSIYTKENIYWIEVNKGLKTGKIKGSGPEPSILENDFTETIHMEENYWIGDFVFDDSWDDYYLWDYVFAGYQGYDTMTITFNVDGVVPISDKAVLTVELKGGSSTEAAPDHHARV